MCVFLQLLCEIFLILRIIKWDIIINAHRSSRKAPKILAKFWSNLYFLERCSKNTHISNFVKIRPVGGHTNMTRVVVTVRKSANAPKNSDWRRLDVITEIQVGSHHETEVTGASNSRRRARPSTYAPKTTGLHFKWQHWPVNYVSLKLSYFPNLENFDLSL